MRRSYTPLAIMVTIVGLIVLALVAKLVWWVSQFAVPLH